MSFSRATVAAILLAGASSALAAEPEWGLSVARSFDAHETDILKLTYRRPLEPHDGARWWPQQLQFGASVWRVHAPVRRECDSGVALGHCFRGFGARIRRGGSRRLSAVAQHPQRYQPPA